MTRRHAVVLAILIGIFALAGCATVHHPPDLSAVAAEKEARYWLSELRRGTMEYETFEGIFRTEVRKAHLTLADLGTSEEELAALHKKGAVIAARYWLAFLIRGSEFQEPGELLGFFFDHVYRGHLTLADVGTNGRELARLLRK